VSFAVLGLRGEAVTEIRPKSQGMKILCLQMRQLPNIEVLNAYEVKKVVTACPPLFQYLKK